ncbi:hypothetical protein [Chlamydia sp. 17-3921]|uniref:tetratricopeptide repeat protein n=1 Tax=Chlamydia sp. 17-3921 TaxID=2675798 RepID=UPI00191A6ED1|nr:hypothetical protein [Chlamydia sp. 17-3921]
MWLVILWTLVTSLAIAVVAKSYYCLICFRRHATQVIREVRLSMELKEWAIAEQKLLPIFKKRFFRYLCLFDYMRILREMERFDEAEKLLAEAHKLKLIGDAFFLEVAYKAFRYGAFKECAQAFSLIPLEKLEEQDAAKFASALVRLGHVNEACSLIEPWISPLSHQETYITVGYIYFISKRYHDAIELYNRACALGPCPIEVTYTLAHANRISSNYIQAGQLFRKLLADPAYKDEALFNIGLCEQKLGKPGRALLIYQSSRLWSSGDALLMKHAALAAMDIQDYFLAERCWKFALNCPIFVEDDKCNLSYGLCLCRLSKYSDAEKIYLKIIQKSPECLIACKALAWLVGVGFATTVVPKEGLMYARKAVQLHHCCETLELLSACEARLGNFDVAYEIQSFLSCQDNSLQQKKRRAQIMRNLRQKLPLSDHHIMEIMTLLAA